MASLGELGLAELRVRNSFALAWVLSRLGLGQADRLEAFGEGVQRWGFRYCPLALELLLGEPEAEVPPVEVLGPEAVAVSVVEGGALIQEEVEPVVEFPGIVPSPEPVEGEPLFRDEFAFAEVPGEPVEEPGEALSL